MNWFKKNAANIVTSTRIIGTLCLIPFETYSLPFYIFYIWCGVSDVIDGFIARTTHTVSRLGSILDTISDLTLYTVMMIKILPDLKAGLNDTICSLHLSCHRNEAVTVYLCPDQNEENLKADTQSSTRLQDS